MVAILKKINIKHSFNLTSDMKRSSQIMPIKFYGDDVIDDVTGWPQSFSLYSCLGEVGSGSKLQGQCLVNKYQYHNCLSRLYMPKDDLNELHFSRLQVKGQSQAYWVTLALISNIANYFKYNYFLYCDGIDNVTLRLWKFSDSYSRHTVGAAGDDIMFHILVKNVVISYIKEYRGTTLRPPCDVMDDVIIMKILFWHNLGRSFHIWGQIEAVFIIKKI